MNRNDINPMRFLGHSVSNRDEIKEHAPAVFASGPSEKVSSRYSFISTIELLDAFEKLGWSPHSVKQMGKGNDNYSRHMIRLNNSELGFMDLRKDKVKPQVILDNSHDRTSNVMAHMGLFRLVCSNGLVVSMPGMYSSIKLRHIGIDFKELKQLTEVIANQYLTIGKHIGDMQNTKLLQDQMEEFVIKAIAFRDPGTYLHDDGTINVDEVTTRVNPTRILDPIRGEDTNEDLWTVFNVVQERLIKGNFEKHNPTGRKSSPRGITNASRNIEFNKLLWSIAEEYLGTEDDLTGKWVYTSAKDKKMNVEIVERLAGNKYKVKSENNLVFAVDVEQLTNS